MISYYDSAIQRKSLRNIGHLTHDHDDKKRMALIKKVSLSDRCCACNYLAQGIEHLKCSNCSKVYHEQCLKKKNLGQLGVREEEWRCTDCIRCTNCLSIKNRNQLLMCQTCNSAFHYDCLDQTVKLSIPSLILNADKDNSATKNVTE